MPAGRAKGSRAVPVAAISVSTLLFRRKGDPIKVSVELLLACGAISARMAQTPALSAADLL